MKNINKNSFLFEDITTLKGVGKRLEKYLKNKKIEKVKDILFDLPYEIVDRSKITSLQNLEIGKISSIQVIVEKYNFPRIRNLPNKVICSESDRKINLIFFNSKEGYIRKILPLNAFTSTNGSATITVNEPNHGRSTSDTVRFRDVESVGGIAATTISSASGFTITKVDDNNYTFGAGTNASFSGTGGGGLASAGPVTIVA